MMNACEELEKQLKTKDWDEDVCLMTLGLVSRRLMQIRTAKIKSSKTKRISKEGKK